jgi:hypothetical protein
VSDGVSPEALARRVAHDLGDATRVWIAPELTILRSLIAPERLSDDGVEVAGGADVAVVGASQLTEVGDVRGPCAAPSARRVWAVLDETTRIVRRCVAPVARVERAFGRFGVIDVTRDGLVIVELARGISATDVQKLAEPTLKISSRVNLMRDSVLPD